MLIQLKNPAFSFFLEKFVEILKNLKNKQGLMTLFEVGTIDLTKKMMTTMLLLFLLITTPIISINNEEIKKWINNNNPGQQQQQLNDGSSSSYLTPKQLKNNLFMVINQLRFLKATKRRRRLNDKLEDNQLINWQDRILQENINNPPESTTTTTTSTQQQHENLIDVVNERVANVVDNSSTLDVFNPESKVKDALNSPTNNNNNNDESTTSTTTPPKNINNENTIDLSNKHHNGQYLQTTTNADIVALVMAMVVAILILPFALLYRLNTRFRNAILLLSGSGVILKSSRKRSVDILSGGNNNTSSSGGGGNNSNGNNSSNVLGMDYYEPKTVNVPANFRSVLSMQDLSRLATFLPLRLNIKDWKLLFATEIHGFNLATAYRKIANNGPCLAAVMDANRHVFCGFCSESLEIHGPMQTFGNGECFVASVHPEFRVFPWRPGNETHFVMASDSFMAFGGGGGMAIWLDATFERGTSERCATYGTNKTIASQESFKCVAVEMWGFVTPSIRTTLSRTALSTVHGVMGRLTRKSSTSTLTAVVGGSSNTHNISGISGSSGISSMGMGMGGGGGITGDLV
jgi:hypothetical protein